MPAIRVGTPDSPVMPGTPVPGKPGKYYEKGQFAPSLDELATSTFAEAKKSGLISTELPIFNDEGEVDADLVEQWEPSKDLPKISVSSRISKFSMATIVTINKLFPDILSSIGVTSILSGDELEYSEGSKAILGDSIITQRVNSRQRAFSSTIYVYERYYQFISTPVVPEIPGRTKGVSVSMYATLKIMGHILFSRMVHEGKLELIGKFYAAGKWTKEHSGKRGEYLGRKNMSNFYRGQAPYTSEIARYSPIDDFADTFAHYLVHRMYLSATSPEKLEVMDEINEHYRLV